MIGSAGFRRIAEVDGNRMGTQIRSDCALTVLVHVDPGGSQQVAESAVRGKFLRWQVNRLVGYIQENLGQPLSGADLCALTRKSHSHFFRTFKATFGEAPFRYIAKRRIERAQEMMLTSDAPLSQIALDCGLCDQSHLTRLFRQFVGMTPNAWRREYAQRSSSPGDFCQADDPPALSPRQRDQPLLTSHRQGDFHG